MNTAAAIDPETMIPDDAIPPAPMPEPVAMDPNLGARIREDAAAMEEDMRKAEGVVIHLQQALTGKDREIEYLKKLQAESAARFGKLQESIAAMRRERHKLANDSMRATGLEMMLKKVTAERDRAVAERDGVLQALADENASKLQYRFDPRDVQIAELTVKLVRVQRELEEAKRAPKPIDIMRTLKTAAAATVDFSA